MTHPYFVQAAVIQWLEQGWANYGPCPHAARQRFSCGSPTGEVFTLGYFKYLSSYTIRPFKIVQIINLS